MTSIHKIKSRLSPPLKRSLMSLTLMSASLAALSGCGYHWGAQRPSTHAFTPLSPCQGFTTWRVEPSPLIVEPPERLQHLLCLGYQEAGGAEEALSSLSASLTFTMRPLSAHISSLHATLSIHEEAQPHPNPQARSTLKEHINISHPPQGAPPHCRTASSQSAS